VDIVFCYYYIIIIIIIIIHVLSGETHEVHAASPSQPGIVVQVCEDPQNFKKHARIAPTPAPQASSQ